MDKGIELCTVVDQLREELVALTRTVKGEQLQFVVESIELELKVGVSRTGGGDAKAKFWVLEVGAKGERKTDETQTIKLKLKPKHRNTQANPEVLVGRGDETDG